MQLILLGEIVVAQKVMYEKFGQDFLFHFVSKGFLTAHCPQDLAEQYCQKLQVHSIDTYQKGYVVEIVTMYICIFNCRLRFDIYCKI